jgi:hypothetical protein
MAFMIAAILSSASHADEMVTLGVRFRTTSVTELTLALPRGCIGHLDGFGPVYEVVDVDVRCVLHGEQPVTPGMRQIIFQVHGYSPAARAPDSNEPHRLTDEDRKALEALGPLGPEPAVASFPISGQVTSTHRMSDAGQKTLDENGREYYWSADTVWLNSDALRSQAMDCDSMWTSDASDARFLPTLSRCHVWLNSDNIELVAVIELTSAISLDTFEQVLAAFEKAAVVK